MHRISPDEVHFHEVGALDALADVVGVVAGFAHLGLTRLTASPVALGSGSARGAHGVVPIPGPAVLELLAGVPVVAGAGAGRDVHAHRRRAGRRTSWTSGRRCRRCGSQRVGIGAGGRDPAELPNVVRLVLGSRPTSRAAGPRRPGDQRRRPGPAAVARRPGRAVRRRRLGRLADPDPDEEGPPGAHAVGAVPARGRRRTCRRRSSRRRRPSACGSCPSARWRWSAPQASVEVLGGRVGVKLAVARRPGGQRQRRVRGRRRARPRAAGSRSRRCCGRPPRAAECRLPGHRARSLSCRGLTLHRRASARAASDDPSRR